AEAGVSGVTFMPSRNTLVQLERVMALCRQHNLCQISGEDVNSLGQSFICEQLQKPQFHHLIDATWALVERERK
ncbi:MAG: PHP domain-containing protein, partial [Eubacteriales bacterium]|nr:PHP domain-containing protein [Eubacteriales bacterium]